MAGRIPPEFIDTLLARTDIVELINARVPLRKAGRDYEARCPFHDEKTPSFTVSREKQFYHCFGCGAHGTAIGFLMEYDRLEFLEAVGELARQAGLEVPREGRRERSGPDLGPLYQVLDEAAALFRRQLRDHPDAGRAVDYLKRRGLSGEVAGRFGIGFAPPGWDLLLRTLGRDAGRVRALLDAGLVVDQDGRRYDRFRERIMFPIRDRRGRVIGFGGRVLGDAKPKYLNSPETPVFHKGRELYGLHEAWQANRKLERVLVVEGYMDVIALAQFDITYACATLGTATTPEHLHLLRSVPEVAFCFDGDRAGRAAAWKAVETALPQANGRQQVRFLFLPDGEDPDTLVRKEGREGFEARLARATPLSELLFEQLTGQADLGSIDGRARLAALAEPLIRQVPAGLYRDMLAGRLAALVGVEPARVGGRSTPRPAPRRPVRPASRQTLNPLRLAVALLLQSPRLGLAAAATPADWRGLSRPGIDLLREILDITTAYPDLSAGALLERWRGSQYETHLRQLADPGLLSHIPEDGRAAELIGALTRLNAELHAADADRLFARESLGTLSEDDKERMRRAVGQLRSRPPPSEGEG